MQKIENPPTRNNDNTDRDDVYIVRKGDTLFSIAKSYGVTVESLKKINNLISDIIQPGQKLTIPR